MESNIGLSIIMTYKSDGSYKDKHLEYSLKRWEYLFPEVEIIVVEDENKDNKGWKTFNKSKLLNRGVKQATKEVLFFCDIDMVFSQNTILKAYREVFNASIVLPLNKIILLQEDISNKIMKLPIEEKISKYPYDASNSEFRMKEGLSASGCYMITKNNYYLAGEHDERFIGWGDEDSAFRDAAITMINAPFVRLEESILHLYHPRGSTTVSKKEKQKRKEFYHKEYRQNRGNKEKMQKIILERYKNN